MVLTFTVVLEVVVDRFGRWFSFLVAGLPSHPQYDVVKRQCSGCSGMITFYIKGKLEQASAFLSSLKVTFSFTTAECGVTVDG